MIDYTLPLDQLPDPLPIEPLTKPFDVTITPPGSKSITCRAYVLAALAEGESRLIRPLRADDTDRLLDALCTLGAQARWEGEDVLITGVGGRFPRGGAVNLGDGGTPTRFMIACACLAAEPVKVDGSPRMRERPIAEGVDMLRQLGAHIEYVEEEGRLPVRVVPSEEFKGGELEVGRTASSQFVSAVLLIAPSLPSPTSIRFSAPPTSKSYIDLTCAVLEQWNAEVRDAVQTLCCRPRRIQSRAFEIEADASSAIFWIAAALVGAENKVEIFGLNGASHQPDCDMLRVLAAAGGDTWTFISPFDESLLISGSGAVRGRSIDAERSPDGAVACAAIAALAPTPTTITGLHTLRVKETDRIAALANELRKVGCTVETTEDSITVTPPTHGRDVRATGGGEGERGSESRDTSEPILIETYNDHRMAMAFAVLGLARPRLAIRNPACVAKSYPGFWKDFAKLYGEGTEGPRD